MRKVDVLNAFKGIVQDADGDSVGVGFSQGCCEIVECVTPHLTRFHYCVYSVEFTRKVIEKTE